MAQFLSYHFDTSPIYCPTLAPITDPCRYANPLLANKNYHRVNGGGGIEQQIWPPQGANFCDMHRDECVKCYRNSIKSDNVVMAIGHFM